MRAIFLLFGVVAYLVFFLTFLCLVGFVGGLPQLPLTVDAGGAVVAPAAAAVVDVGLIALFGLQHSVMARPGFKRAWARVVPPPVERSVYVLLASAALILLMLLWRPIPAVLWSVASPVGAGILWLLFGLGWLIVLLSTFLISHFELFGLTQVWNHMRGRDAAPPVFRQPLFYRVVRHPLYSGFFLAFWATPRMTVGHLVLALGLAAYMLIAIRYEERDLTALFGDDYRAYSARTGMLLPGLGRRRS